MKKAKEYSVIIVCDGKSSINAVNSLCKYIDEEAIIRGQKCCAKVISASDYRDDLSKHHSVNDYHISGYYSDSWNRKWGKN